MTTLTITDPDKIFTEDEIRLQNCAGCNVEMLGSSFRGVRSDQLPDGHKLKPKTEGTIGGRPYCGLCLGVRGWAMKERRR